jgi:hypothetical protein
MAARNQPGALRVQQAPNRVVGSYTMTGFVDCTIEHPFWAPTQFLKVIKTEPAGNPAVHRRERLAGPAIFGEAVHSITR